MPVYEKGILTMVSLDELASKSRSAFLFIRACQTTTYPAK
jgi:hypothetical protein